MDVTFNSANAVSVINLKMFFRCCSYRFGSHSGKCRSPLFEARPFRFSVGRILCHTSERLEGALSGRRERSNGIEPKKKKPGNASTKRTTKNKIKQIIKKSIRQVLYQKP